MEDIDWRIESGGITGSGFIVLTDQDPTPLNSLLGCFMAEDLHELVGATVSEVGYEENGIGFGLSNNVVEVYDPVSVLELPKRVFAKIVAAVVQAVLDELDSDAGSELSRELKNDLVVLAPLLEG